MDKKWFVLVNPAAGGNRAKKCWPGIADLLKANEIDYEPYFSKSPGDAVISVSNAVENGFRRFIAVGGDGTLNLTVNGIFHKKTVDTTLITLAMIPVGTGNDWIRTHRIPSSFSKATSVIRHGQTQLHDIGVLHFYHHEPTVTKYFINMAGFGFQGFVVQRIEEVSSGIKKGVLSYVLGIFKALFKYETTSVRLKFDDGQIDGKIYNVNAGICKYCGGGMKMAPDASAVDGLFDITVIKKISKTEVILNIPGLFSGRFVRNKKVSRYRSATLHLISEPNMPVECDGEMMGYGDAHLEIIPKSLAVVIPQ